MFSLRFLGFGQQQKASAAESTLLSKGVSEDELSRSLIEVLASVLLLIGLFALPSVAALFEDEHAAWQQTNEVGRIRRKSWPLLKDPDSLLTIQTLLRCVLLALALHCNSSGIGKRRGSARGRLLTSAGVVLFSTAYATRVMLFQFSLFRMEGPLGGRLSLAADIAATVFVFLAAASSLLGCRPFEVMGTLMLTALLFSMSGWVAGHNYLVVDPEAGAGANAAFTFMNLVEAVGAVSILAGLIAGVSWKPGMVMRLLVAFQQALSFYYVMDSLEKAPQSTLSFGMSDPEFQVVALPMQGRPEELLLFAQGVQLGVTLVACLMPAAEPRLSCMKTHRVEKSGKMFVV